MMNYYKRNSSGGNEGMVMAIKEKGELRKDALHNNLSNFAMTTPYTHLINWLRRIMETFSQFAIVTPGNQRRPLCQVSLFILYQ